MAKSMTKVLGESGAAYEFEDDGAGAVVQKFNGNDQIATITDPTGGATTDAEARAAIADIIDALQAAGIIA
jgi:hypothetical protein